MRDFFEPWRRKLGVVTLVVACLFAAGWVRSCVSGDWFHLSTGDYAYDGLNSFRGNLVWIRIRDKDKTGSPELFAERGGNLMDSICDPKHVIGWEQVEWQISWKLCGVCERKHVIPVGYKLTTLTIPFWTIICPLTLLSAWLLLSKPRPTAKSEPAPTTGA